MKKFKLIVPSFVAIVICALLIAGSSLALFTTEASGSMSVTSAKVKYEANLAKVGLSHVEADDNGTIQDENHATYSRVYGSFFDTTSTGEVVNNAVSLSKMAPGDKAEYTLTATNSSNIDTKYRFRMEVEENTALASGMLVSIGKAEQTPTEAVGMVVYQSEWATLAANTNLVYNISFELPLTAGNEYQLSEVQYNFVIEGVQGNAKTNGEANYETIGAYVKKVQSAEPVEISTTEATNVAVTANDVQIDEAKLSVSASIPKDNTFKNAGNETMAVTSTSLEVSDLFVSTNSETNETSIAADVKLLDQDGNEIKSVDSEKPVTVSVYVGKGFNSVKVKHNGNLVEGSRYNSTTGYVEFETTTFSPFEFIGDFAALIGTTYYGSLKAAFDAAEDGETVRLIKDITVDVSNSDDFGFWKSGSTYYGLFYYLEKAVNIDGGNHTITTTNAHLMPNGKPNTGFIYYDYRANSVSITNLNVVSEGFAYAITYGGVEVGSMSNCKIVSDNCCVTISAFSASDPRGGVLTINNSEFSFIKGELTRSDYAPASSAVASQYGSDVILNNCKVTASDGGALYVWPSGGTITANNCKLNCSENVAYCWIGNGAATKANSVIYINNSTIAGSESYSVQTGTNSGHNYSALIYVDEELIASITEQ